MPPAQFSSAGFFRGGLSVALKNRYANTKIPPAPQHFGVIKEKTVFRI
jgi:hypothetical protein